MDVVFYQIVFSMCTLRMTSLIFVLLLFGVARVARACVPRYEFDGTAVSCLSEIYGFQYVEFSRFMQCAIYSNPFADHCEEKYRTCVRACDNDDQCVFPYFDEVKRQKCISTIEDNIECNYGQRSRFVAPRNTKFCQCEKNSDCFNQQICKQGVCVCENNSNCGTSQICVHGPYSWNGFSRRPNFGRAIGKPNGECFCDLENPIASCNNNGACVRRNPPETNFAHPVVLPVPHGTPHLQHGLCRCYKGWGGKFCERNVAKETRCNNRGRPLCRAPNTKLTDLNVKSLFTNQELGVGECDFAKLGFADTPGVFPGDLGCQCDRSVTFAPHTHNQLHTCFITLTLTWIFFAFALL